MVGLVITRRRLTTIRDRRVFLGEFADRFMRYVGSAGQDEAVYVELTQRVVRMQRELGGHGVMGMYRPPFANYAVHDYPILLNMLPEYRTAANDWALKSQANQYSSTIRDVLVRYSGALEEAELDALRAARNPLVWFREGVRAAVALPFRLLGSLGILSPAATSGIVGSSLVRVASGFVALVTLVAGCVQIITGWDATIVFIHQFLGR
jgi:hypothetical protein